MKHTLSTCVVAVAALLAGTAIAGDQPRSDAPRDEMRADTDGDGRVSRAEATSAGEQRSGEWFDKLDLNKDGYVTQEEMKQARETRHGNMRADMKAKMEERFKAADTNGDGQLSLDEVQAKMPRMADRFGEIDQDKNGLLTKEELQRSGPRHGGQPKPQS
jgi:Ca2+-binding EF-hand superfamily protein